MTIHLITKRIPKGRRREENFFKEECGLSGRDDRKSLFCSTQCNNWVRQKLLVLSHQLKWRWGAGDHTVPRYHSHAVFNFRRTKATARSWHFSDQWSSGISNRRTNSGHRPPELMQFHGGIAFCSKMLDLNLKTDNQTEKYWLWGEEISC